MRRLEFADSWIAQTAHAVPAGGALAVDRDGFSGDVTQTLQRASAHRGAQRRNDGNSGRRHRRHRDGTADGSRVCRRRFKQLLGEEYFYFYDAAAPIVEKDSIDMSKVYLGIPI